MIHECKHVRCVCKSDGKTYEVSFSYISLAKMLATFAIYLLF